MISIIMYKVSKYYSTVCHTGLKVIRSFITSSHLVNTYQMPTMCQTL